MKLAGGFLAVALAGIAASQTASQDALLARLAIELAVDRDPAPLSLGPGPTSQYGSVYDRFTQAHLKARIAFLRGTPLDALKPPAGLLPNQIVIVANTLRPRRRVPSRSMSPA